MYETIYSMPKGADLHTHLTGAGYPMWWYDTAVAHGYTIQDKNTWLEKMSIRYNLKPMLRIPTMQADIMYRNMVAYSQENVSYVELIIAANETLIRTLQNRLEKQDAIDTGVTVRFLITVLRSLPEPIRSLEYASKLVKKYELCVGVNLGGREEDFPPTMFTQIDVPFAVHAGEMTKANSNIKDSLAIGADRIGHGLNLISDKETMHSIDKLVEISLISNVVLNKIEKYEDHPLPEYIKAGVPVAMMTDNRGLWKTTLTDEYYQAAKLGVSLQDIQTMCRNSLVYSFADSETKQRLLDNFDKQTIVL